MQFIDFPMFDEPKQVQYILRRMHDEFMWLDKPHNITKSAIKAVTCLSSVGEIPALRNVKNQMVIKATGYQFDKRLMTINDIIEQDVRFASMVMGYKIYHSSRDNLISDTTIYDAYQILKEDSKCFM